MGQSELSNNAGHRGAVEPSASSAGNGYETLVQKGLDGENELSVLVSGVHCAGCIQKIESSLAKEQDVKKARLNFSTGRLAMGWAGDAARANDLVALVEKLGYGVKPYDPKTEQDDADKQEKFLLICLGVAGFATGNIMLLSPGVWLTDGETMGMATREFLHLIAGLISVPTVIFAGRPFFRSALKALRGGHTNMDVPISLALVLSTVMSIWELSRGAEHVYFDAAVMLIFFLLIGRYLDFRARRNARSVATDLLSTLSGFATVLERTGTRRIPIRDLREEMLVQVASGEKFPVDGLVEQGQSSVDTSLVTGETVPRDIERGSAVYAGTLNISAPVIIKVEKAAEDSLLADVVRLMEKAGQGQAVFVRIADRAAKLYTPIVHTLAATAFIYWFFLGGMVWQDALMISVALLIITCPCALALAVPVTQVLATGRLTKKGILVKSGDALERLSKIDMAIFDKTGTLTLGKPVLQGAYDHTILQKAASLAAHSRHPLSKGIAEGYAGETLAVEAVQEHAGKGLEGRIDGTFIRLGSRSWCGDVNAAQSDDLELWFAEEGAAPVRFILKDVLRPDAAQTLHHFHHDKIKTVLLSGDREMVAKEIAAGCGIDEYFAEKTPPQKYEILEGYKQQGHNVLMVGDGLNDAPVLAAADVSIAPGTAIDMAQNAADIVFMGDTLEPVYEAHRTAKFAQKLVIENFGLTILYNAIVVPMAMMGMVTPMIAAIAMSASSLVVIANSFRIKWVK